MATTRKRDKEILNFRSLTTWTMLAGLIGMLANVLFGNFASEKTMLILSAFSAGIFAASAGLITCERAWAAALGHVLITSAIVFMVAFALQDGMRPVVEPFFIGGSLVLAPAMYFERFKKAEARHIS